MPGYKIDQIKLIKEEFNLKLVVDLDDYWDLYKHHIIYQDWMLGDMPNRIRECVKMADLVTVTHEKLAEECRQLNANVAILPNSLPFGHDQFIYNPIESENFNILYAGGNSHLHDINSVANLFRRLGSDGFFKEKARFILGGYHNPDNDPRSVWFHIERIVKRCVAYEKFGAQPVAEYMKMYDSANLSVAPLEENKFNTYKSNLKTVESGCKHVPIICTDIHPYNIDVGAPGVTLCNNVNDWYKTIMYYAKNPNAAKDDGDALFEYVSQKYNLLEVNKTRYQLLKSLL